MARDKKGSNEPERYKATASAVAEYIRRAKIEASKMSLESSRGNVNEVMYKVGYTDTKAFRTTNKKISGNFSRYNTGRSTVLRR